MLISNTVSVIDTATNTVVATVPVGSVPAGVAVTPDGKHAYVTNFVPGIPARFGDRHGHQHGGGHGPGGELAPLGSPSPRMGNTPMSRMMSPTTVSVIDTATNTVVATVPVGSCPFGVAVTPDGKHAYVANDLSSNTVSVIDTATNTVVATVGVGNSPIAVGIVPPPPGVPFLAFSALLAIQFGGTPNQDAFGFGSNITLSSTAPAINPVTQPVTLQVGSFATTIPIGSFVAQKDGSFAFKGVIDGVSLEALIKQTGTLRYAFQAKATGANLTGTTNTVYVTLAIGGDKQNSGATSVTAAISH